MTGGEKGGSGARLATPILTAAPATSNRCQWGNFDHDDHDDDDYYDNDDDDYYDNDDDDYYDNQDDDDVEVKFAADSAVPPSSQIFDNKK